MNQKNINQAWKGYMRYIPAMSEDILRIYEIVQETIQTVYPKYYPSEVVDFFCAHHSMENITEDVNKGKVGVLYVEDEMVGTGSFTGGHITRVYVLPKHQGKGCGTFIMHSLEMEIAKQYDKAELDASLPAAQLYEKMGYRTVRHEKFPVENEAILAYEIMEKQLSLDALRKWKAEDLLYNLEKLHTTELGAKRMKENITAEVEDVVEWCREKIGRTDAVISGRGKNWYIKSGGYELTVNAGSLTIITVHKIKH